MTGSKTIVLVAVVIFALLGVVAWVLVRAAVGGVQTSEGYFAPVYSPDGQYVYFVERRTSGTVRRVGPIDLFSPSKFDVQVAKDNFSLKRLHVQSSQVEELIGFTPSPTVGQRYEAIGSPFQGSDAQLRFTKERQLQFNVCLKAYEGSAAREYLASGLWSEAQTAAQISRSWKSSWCQMGGYDEWPLFGDWELMEVRGETASFPVGIAAYNHVTSDVKVLVKAKDYDRLYPKGVPLQQIQKSSVRPAIERLQAMLRTHEELLQKYRAEGMGENQALLRVGKDMQRLGYYPKTPTIVARRLSRDEEIDKNALFSIAKDEMASGVFPDIEKAIASPGEEIDYDGTGYHIHRDYSTSARLNTFLATRPTRFYVRYLGETYELTIKRP